MKLQFKALLAAASFLTPFSLCDAAQLYATPPTAANSKPDGVSHRLDEDATSYSYVGSNARWLVDRKRGIVSAWSLEEASPLWSLDGVVYRISPNANHAIPITKISEKVFPPSAWEIFGRVYFLLDDVADSRSFHKTPTRRDALLIAIDPNAQGRLVWECRAQDFAPFFPKNARGRLRFIDNVNSSPRDELVVLVQGEKEIKRFALDAATGTPRLLETPAESR